ncbi:MAG TPA: hypothetical protein VH143_14855 [Kofleriaceae bacterium]|jgi:hypothetical protein|nr:hypothetical protein [Kofleriaceae bacterium]
MRTVLLLALVACVSPTAAADPAPAQNRMRPACAEAKGPVLVAVDRIKTGAQGSPDQKQTATLFDDGAWSMTDTAGGKPESGCVPDADFKRVKAELAQATWQIAHAKFRCMLMSLVRTEYSVEGKLVWTAKVCSGETLDKASATAISDVDAVVQKLDPNRQKLN